MPVSTVNISFEKEWHSLFDTGKKIGETLDISEDDLMDEIKSHRRTQKSLNKAGTG